MVPPVKILQMDEEFYLLFLSNNMFLHNMYKCGFLLHPLLAKTIICLPDCKRYLLSKSFGWMG